MILSGSGFYHSWYNMLDRCYNKLSHAYKNYGYRGIKVCDRWKDQTPILRIGRGRPLRVGLQNFYEDMGDSWFNGASIDRIDNDGDYTPENCQWLIRKDNAKKAHIGRKQGVEEKLKRSKSLMGHIMTPETRLKISVNNAMKNPITRKKIGTANRGKIRSEETRKKLSESKKGKKFIKIECHLCHRAIGANNLHQHLLKCNREQNNESI